MISGEKTYFKAKTIAEALHFAEENKNAFRYLAGGTDVLINKFQGNDEINCFIDISGIDELKQVSTVGDSLKIGSLVRLDDLKLSSEINNSFPALIEAAHSVASPMLRKTATIGGNVLCENRCIFYNQSEWWREAVGYCLKCDGDICIATGGKKNCFSKFVSDTAPVLISLNATIEIVDRAGIKVIPLESIYSGDGINPRTLSNTSLIKNIILPLHSNFKTVFKKLRPREAVDFTSLTTALTINKDGKIKIVLGGVDPRPIVVEGTHSDSKDELIKKAVKKARVIDNDFYSRTYRKEMISVFLNTSFKEVENLYAGTNK